MPNAERLQEIISASSAYLLSEENVITVEGISFQWRLRRDLLEQYRDEIITMLWEVSPTFRAKHGEGGWSFVKLHLDTNGNPWGNELDANHLAIAAIALDLACWLPHDLAQWEDWPLGKPYFVIFDHVFDDRNTSNVTQADESSTIMDRYFFV